MFYVKIYTEYDEMRNRRWGVDWHAVIDQLRKVADDLEQHCIEGEKGERFITDKHGNKITRFGQRELTHKEGIKLLNEAGVFENKK